MAKSVKKLSTEEKAAAAAKALAEPYNGKQIQEVEHYRLNYLVYIFQNWDKLGDKVGKAFVNGELIDNHAFKTVIEKLILNTETNDQIFPFGNNKVVYSQGELGYGRYQTKNFGLINMARPVRHTLARGLYQDIDFVNCHLYIYKYLCFKYQISASKICEYIDKREDKFKEMMKLNKDISKDDCKKWFLSLLNGGLGRSIKRYTKFMKEFESELRTIQPKLCKEIENVHPELRAHVLKKNGPETWNLTCKIVSKELENYENQMRHYLAEYVKLQGFDFSSHCYDGGMSYLSRNKLHISELEKKLGDAQAYIKAKISVDCPLKFKQFDEMIDIPEDEIKKITIQDYTNIIRGSSEDYESVKYRFEKENFFCEDTCKYICEKRNKTRVYDRATFVTKYEDITYETIDEDGEVKKESFIYKWIKDSKKRRYDSVVWEPIGHHYEKDENEQDILRETDRGYDKRDYNTWKGFDVERYTLEETEEIVKGRDCILNHFKYLVNGDETHYNYFLKWIASLFQKPHTKTGVVTGIKSVLQGIGKTYIYDLMTEMMGADLVAKIVNPERDLFGDFNELIHQTIFVLLEEWDAGVNLKYQKAMLDAITSTVDNINFKGGKKEKCDSFNNYMCVWNTYGLRVEEGDRRVWALENTAETKPSTEYFNQLYSHTKNRKVLRSLYEFLLRIDIRTTHFQNDRPSTKLREEMISQQRDKIYNFMTDYILLRWRIKEGYEQSQYNQDIYEKARGIDERRETSKHLFENFTSWCAENRIQYKTDNKTFGKKLMSLKITSLERYDSCGASKYIFYINDSIKWLLEQKLITEDILRTDKRDNTNIKQSQCIEDEDDDFDDVL
jgi:hypothetical protein